MTVITTINSGDLLEPTSRNTINANFSALNTTFIDNEVVSGSGTSWTLANTPVSSSVHLYGNGQFLTSGAGNDYTISGTNITTTNSYSSGALIANYRK